ncbi:hypothetical protein CHARACLAT_007674 [Characodon lateralis]|uniref:Uncharacterized protein n=1 Tax=Characodon lateralis TaxID=208331 RepID=A0ABU7F132_9TELE|nr:hypothetical protein [Characodon lateralis]
MLLKDSSKAVEYNLQCTGVLLFCTRGYGWLLECFYTLGIHEIGGCHSFHHKLSRKFTEAEAMTHWMTQHKFKAVIYPALEDEGKAFVVIPSCCGEIKFH